MAEGSVDTSHGVHVISRRGGLIEKNFALQRRRRPTPENNRFIVLLSFTNGDLSDFVNVCCRELSEMILRSSEGIKLDRL